MAMNKGLNQRKTRKKNTLKDQGSEVRPRKSGLGPNENNAAN